MDPKFRCVLEVYGNAALATSAREIIEAVYDFDDDDDDFVSHKEIAAAPCHRTQVSDLSERPITRTYLDVHRGAQCPILMVATVAELSSRLPELRFVLKSLSPDSGQGTNLEYHCGRVRAGAGEQGGPGEPASSRTEVAEAGENMAVEATSSHLLTIARDRFKRACPATLPASYVYRDNGHLVFCNMGSCEVRNYLKYEVIKTLMTPEELAKCVEMERGHRAWMKRASAMTGSADKLREVLCFMWDDEIQEYLSESDRAVLEQVSALSDRLRSSAFDWTTPA
jgi:hypothetical protein